MDADIFSRMLRTRTHGGIGATDLVKRYNDTTVYARDLTLQDQLIDGQGLPVKPLFLSPYRTQDPYQVLHASFHSQIFPDPLNHQPVLHTFLIDHNQTLLCHHTVDPTPNGTKRVQHWQRCVGESVESFNWKIEKDLLKEEKWLRKRMAGELEAETESDPESDVDSVRRMRSDSRGELEGDEEDLELISETGSENMDLDYDYDSSPQSSDSQPLSKEAKQEKNKEEEKRNLLLEPNARIKSCGCGGVRRVTAGLPNPKVAKQFLEILKESPEIERELQPRPGEIFEVVATELVRTGHGSAVTKNNLIQAGVGKIGEGNAAEYYFPSDEMAPILALSHMMAG